MCEWMNVHMYVNVCVNARINRYVCVYAPVCVPPHLNVNISMARRGADVWRAFWMETWQLCYIWAGTEQAPGCEMWGVRRCRAKPDNNAEPRPSTTPGQEEGRWMQIRSRTADKYAGNHGQRLPFHAWQVEFQGALWSIFSRPMINSLWVSKAHVDKNKKSVWSFSMWISHPG